MLTSFVLRVAPAALAAGVLAGEVEHVASGQRAEFRNAEDLAAWCAQTARAVVPEPRGGQPLTIALDPASPPLVRKSRS